MLALALKVCTQRMFIISEAHQSAERKEYSQCLGRIQKRIQFEQKRKSKRGRQRDGTNIIKRKNFYQEKRYH